VRCAFGCRTRNLDVSARVLELMRFVDEHCRRTTHRRATFKSHARATIWRMTHLSGWIRTAVALLGFGRGHRAPALLAAESAIPEYGWELGLLMALSLCYWCCSYKSLFPGSHRHRNDSTSHRAAGLSRAVLSSPHRRGAFIIWVISNRAACCRR
jgi:hypothetical protein